MLGQTAQDLAPDPSFAFFSPLLPSVQAWSLGSLHFGRNLTYLKISGVLGLGGGSAAY